MNNLKRVLSVGMASTMVLGMMATASAASFNDFTDKDDIVNKDAVSMVTELGIIAGLPNGSYGATQNIDRASFARLVCVALNGGKEPNLGNLKTTFTDPHPVKRTTKKYKDFTRHRKYAVLCNRRFG